MIALSFVACSAIMDCVGCEKCRLWGKLQVLGLGTALKILFTVDGQENGDQAVSSFCLFVAFIHIPEFERGIYFPFVCQSFHLAKF